MGNWTREIFPFSELLRRLGGDGSDIPWVTESDDGPWQYRIIRSSAHDGTYLFTVELMREIVLPLLLRESCWREQLPPPSWLRPEHVRYEVGRVRHATVVGKVNLPCGRYPGQRESFVLPVRCIITEGGRDG